MRTIIILTFLIVLTFQQHCLNHNGDAVDWLVLLHTPKTVSSGYLYFDSLTQTSQFKKFSERPDSLDHPINRTLGQLNGQPHIKYIAWNDQNPNGSTTSVRAHSKNVLMFDERTKKGIVIVHSMPKYPPILEGIVNATIPDSQSIYGQHFCCYEVSGSAMTEIIDKSSAIRPYIYAST